MREHVARHRAPVLYGDTRDEWGMSQSAGHTFDGGFASGSARVHNGDHHGTVNHYNYAGSGAPLPDRSDDQSKVAIALAMESLSFTQIDVRQASVRIAHTSTCKWLFDRPEYSNEQLCLDYACHGNDRDVVNVLLDHNADVNALWAPRTFIHLPESARPRSLIFATSSTGDADGLRLLLDSGADANVSNGEEFYDALAHACRFGYTNIVSILLAKEATVSLLEADYYCALVDVATRRYHALIVRLLFEQCDGCRAQERDLYVGSLLLASKWGFGDIADILRYHGVQYPGPNRAWTSSSRSS